MRYFIIVLISVCSLMQANIGGYAIFDYQNSEGDQAFDVKRAYLQYTDDLSDDLFFKFRLDVGRDSDGNDDKLSAYIKNVYVDWSCKCGGVLSMGLIGTNTYGAQENTWGYRFVEKSLLDRYKMTNTADFGIGYSVDFGNLNVSMQSLNGEGYKNTDSDGEQSMYFRLLYGEGSLNKTNGYNFGLVGSSSMGDDLNDMVGIFAGYSNEKVRLGVEFNSLDTGIKEEAVGLYGNYNVCESWDVFARHDINTIDVDEHSSSLVGAVWKPTKGLYISPNVAINEDSNVYRVTCMFKY